MKVYLDEDVGGFTQHLAAAGHDVLSVVASSERRGRTDAWHFMQALRDRRLLVTWNRPDFEYLHKLWTTLHTLEVVSDPHAGIVTVATAPGFTKEQWLPPLMERLAAAETMLGRLLRWVPGRNDWVEDRTRPELA
jgi:hypothetical protein